MVLGGHSAVDLVQTGTSELVSCMWFSRRLDGNANKSSMAEVSPVCLAGQNNYGYANACEDLLAETRRAEGLPALSIQWGVIDGVGVADAHIQARFLSHPKP